MLNFYNIPVLPSIFGLYIAYISFSWLKNKRLVPLIETKKLSEDEQYIETNKQSFLDSYIDFSIDKMNENIDVELYDLKLYKTNPDNPHESSWKLRILDESTPKGDVIMFYDIYKHAFTYYADSSMSYSILNAVAMKYVLRFLCRDFFIDNYIIPIGYSTPFLHIHNMVDVDDKPKNEKIDIKNGPFAKFKQYSTNNSEKTNKKESEPKGLIFIKNKFIHLGKLHNFQQTNKNITIEIPIDEPMKPVKYSDFKSWRDPPILPGDTINHFSSASSN